MSLAAKGALNHHLQHRTTLKIQDGRQGVWKGVFPLDFGRVKQLSQNKFFDPSTPSMRKGRDGGNGKKTGGKKEKWPLRHCQQSTAGTPTAGTPHARAKILL